MAEEIVGATVTINQIYDKVTRMSEQLTTVEGKVESIWDHEQRIRTLEKRQWKVAGAVGAVTFVITVAASFAVRAIFGV